MFSACQALKMHLNDAATLSSKEMVRSFKLSQRGSKIPVSLPVSVCLLVRACVFNGMPLDGRVVVCCLEGYNCPQKLH